MGTMGSARVEAANDLLIVAVEAYPEGAPFMSPDTGSQDSGVQLFPLYAVILLFLRPPTLKP